MATGSDITEADQPGLIRKELKVNLGANLGTRFPPQPVLQFLLSGPVNQINLFFLQAAFSVVFIPTTQT